MEKFKRSYSLGHCVAKHFAIENENNFLLDKFRFSFGFVPREYDPEGATVHKEHIKWMVKGERLT